MGLSWCQFSPRRPSGAFAVLTASRRSKTVGKVEETGICSLWRKPVGMTMLRMPDLGTMESSVTLVAEGVTAAAPAPPGFWVKRAKVV
jgi:hypothetical protein